MATTRKIRRVSGGRPEDEGFDAEGDASEESSLEPGELTEEHLLARLNDFERRMDDLLRRFRNISEESARATGKAVQAAEAVEKLKNETLENMQVAFDENAEILEAIEKDVTDIKSQFGAEAAAQIARLDGRFSALERASAELGAQTAALQASLLANQQQVSDLVAKRVAVLEGELRAAQTKWAADSAEKGATSKEFTELSRQFEQLSAKVATELEKGRTVRTEVETALASAGGAVEKTAEAFKRLDDFNRQFTGSQQTLKQLLDAVRETGSGVETNRERVSLTMRIAEEVEEKVRRLVAPVDDAMSSLEDFELSGSNDELGFDLHDLLHVVVKHQASDLHIKAGAPPTVRLDGELIPVGDQVLTAHDCKRLVFNAISRAQRRRLFERKDLDFAYSTPSARFRVNAFLQKGSVSAAFRLLRTEIPTLEQLGLPPVLKELASCNHGLILVTGPAGMGKSTTLAAMIDFINENFKKHIITIEDPVEFLHNDKQALVTQREIGSDATSFTDALKQGLRQDPNVILIGEMRDAETMITAAMAAETGHLVLSTLHTPNATQAIDRILDAFPSDQQPQFRLLLANVLRGVVSQRLVPRKDGQGRVPAVEVMLATSTITSLILEGQTQEIYQYIQQGGTEGMQTFTQSLTGLYEAGVISREDALYHADQPTEFRMGTSGHSSRVSSPESSYSGGSAYAGGGAYTSSAGPPPTPSPVAPKKASPAPPAPAASAASTFSSEGDTLMNWL